MCVDLQEEKHGMLPPWPTACHTPMPQYLPQKNLLREEARENTLQQVTTCSNVLLAAPAAAALDLKHYHHYNDDIGNSTQVSAHQTENEARHAVRKTKDSTYDAATKYPTDINVEWKEDAIPEIADFSEENCILAYKRWSSGIMAPSNMNR